MGKFITFEGPDGAGKTTVLNNIINRLKHSEFNLTDFVITREPGGTEAGNQIRKIVLDEPNINIDIGTEVLLFAAARRQHVVEKIKPALNAGKIVLSDRFLDSSVAYQGGGRHFGLNQVLDINRYATENLQPDVTFYLKLDPETGLDRINQLRSDEVNRLDEEKISFYQDTVAAYEQIINKNPERFSIIDASRPLSVVTDDVWNQLLAVI